MRRRWILIAGFVACMKDTRLPKCVMFRELVGARTAWGGRKNNEWGVSWTASELSVLAANSGRRLQSPGRWGMSQGGETRD